MRTPDLRARLRRPLLVAALLLGGPALGGGTARLLTTDAAEPVDRPVLGLQRSALPLGAGLSVDTALLASLGLALNVGLRWWGEVGPHRLVVGARYTHFVGADAYSALIHSQEAQVIRFAPELSGPTLYGVYGLSLGALLLQVELRASLHTYPLASATGGLLLGLAPGWAVVVEGGYRFVGGPPLRLAFGVRRQGERFGLTLGAAYVQIEDPMFPAIPVLPVVDLSWTF